ncbi:hypothetical protein SDC9_145382 [bioreactor metagenome]|uniref:Uncharacterized protein n=1 Tax=bioreactor metagenome TaxID=1076179 RepID=A0A645E9W5_9ZZZZ
MASDGTEVWSAAAGLDHAPRSRRLLRLGRAARQAVPARQAGHRRRPRPARRGRHRLVRGPDVRGALGDADARGAATVPERRLPGRPVRRLPDGQQDRDGHPRGPLPAGRTAVARRGVRRPRRRPRAARPVRRGHPRGRRPGQGRGRRADRRTDLFGRPGQLEVHRQARLRTRQARRHPPRRAGHRDRDDRPAVGTGDPRGRAGHLRPAVPPRRGDGRRPAAPLRTRTGPRTRPGARHRAARPRLRPRRPRGLS